MANRHKDFEEYIAKQFKNLAFSQSYITNLVNNEELSLEEARRESIKSMGLQFFEKRAEVSVSYISDFVNMRRKWRTDNLIKYMDKIFKLKIKFSIEVQ